MAGILKVDQVQSDSNLSFQIAGANVAYMNSTGLQMTGSTLSLGGTTIIPAVGQYAFPATQNANADANTLDDYEEGTFAGGSITGVNLTSLTLGYGYYTKIGRLVTLNFSINATVTTSNILTYVNLAAPFAAGATTTGSGFLNNNVKVGVSQLASSSLYVFFPAASAVVAGAEVIQASISYIT